MRFDNIAIDSITAFPGIENRPVDNKHLDSLVAIDEANDWPPIDVMQNSQGGFYLINGQHRLLAATELGFETIGANIHDAMSAIDIIQFRFRDNLKHGKPPSDAERKEYAIWLNDTFEMSQKEISQETGLSESTISRLLNGDNRTKEGFDTPEKAAKALHKTIVKTYEEGNGIFFKKHKKLLIAELKNDPDALNAYRIMVKAMAEAIDTVESSLEKVA